MADIAHANLGPLLPGAFDDEPGLDDWIRSMQLSEPLQEGMRSEHAHETGMVDQRDFSHPPVQPAIPTDASGWPGYAPSTTLPAMIDHDMFMNQTVNPLQLYSPDPDQQWQMSNQSGLMPVPSNGIIPEPAMDDNFGMDAMASDAFPFINFNEIADDFAVSSGPEEKATSAATKRTRFSDQQTGILEGWLAVHKHDPYPTPEEVATLSKLTGLDTRKVRNWFTRARQRKLAVPDRMDIDPVPEHEPNMTYPTPVSAITARRGSSGIDDESSLLSVKALAPSSRGSFMGSTSSLLAMSPGATSTDVLPKTQGLHAWDGSRIEWWLTLLDINTTPAHPTVESTGGDISSLLDQQPLPKPGELSTNLQPLSGVFGMTPDYTAGPSVRSSFQSEPYESFIAAATAASQLDDDMDMSDADGTEDTWLGEGENQPSLHLDTTEGSIRSGKLSTYRGSRRSRISDDSRSVLSAHSTDSKAHSIACSYTSYGSRKGRRRPRAVNSGPKQMYTKYQSFEGQVRMSTIRVAQPLEPLPEGHASETKSILTPLEPETHLIGFDNKPKYQCAFCNKIFTRKSTCKRHEKATHAPEAVWICCPNPHDDNRGCFFCRFSLLPANAGCPHDMRSCYERNERDRTFYRKDNFKQHLMGTHKVSELHLRSIDLKAWEEKVESSALADRTCPLCGLVESSIGAKLDHLARHYENNKLDPMVDFASSGLAQRTCEICGSVEASAVAKAEHMMRLHKDALESPAVKTRPVAAAAASATAAVAANTGNSNNYYHSTTTATATNNIAAARDKSKPKATTNPITTIPSPPPAGAAIALGAPVGTSAAPGDRVARRDTKVQKSSLKHSLKTALNKLGGLPAIPELMR